MVSLSFELPLLEGGLDIDHTQPTVQFLFGIFLVLLQKRQAQQ